VRLPAGKVFALLLAAITVASAALFASRVWWFPPAAAEHAAQLDAQFHWTLIDCAVVFIIAQLLLAGLVWAFGLRPAALQSAASPTVDSAVPPRSAQGRLGVTAAIVVGTLFITVELFSAATLGRDAWASMYWPLPSGDVVRVQALGQQFAFYFRYPGADGQFGPIHVDKIDASVGNYFGLDRARDPASKDDIESATLVLPVNRPVELVLGAQDVIHSFYVRELRIQQDMVPGMQIPVRFTPTKIGKYEIVCTQLCGLGHYRMRAYLQVMPEMEFEQWMRQQAR
jgi:cytochrome c oxidase subunit 2